MPQPWQIGIRMVLEMKPIPAPISRVPQKRMDVPIATRMGSLIPPMPAPMKLVCLKMAAHHLVSQTEMVMVCSIPLMPALMSPVPLQLMVAPMAMGMVWAIRAMLVRKKLDGGRMAVLKLVVANLLPNLSRVGVNLLNPYQAPTHLIPVVIQLIQVRVGEIRDLGIG